MEKHWKSVINRSICDYFFEAQAKVTDRSYRYCLHSPLDILADNNNIHGIHFQFL